MTMTPEAIEARRKYKREWNRRNKDKVKAAQKRYWERKAAQAKTQQEDQGDQHIHQSGGGYEAD